MPVKTGAQLINEAKQRVRETSVSQVRDMQAHGAPAVYLNVREQNEWNLGHLPQATFMPRGVLETTIDSACPGMRRSWSIVPAAIGRRWLRRHCRNGLHGRVAPRGWVPRVGRGRRGRRRVIRGQPSPSRP